MLYPLSYWGARQIVTLRLWHSLGPQIEDHQRMSLQSTLTTVFAEAFAAQDVDASFGEVVVSQRPELADYQCNGALGAAKSAGRNPRELAEAVVAAIDEPTLIESLEIAGPGFINIVITPDLLCETVGQMAGSERLGVDIVEHPRTVIVDYGGPNMSKALHVGHLRAAVIGESLKRLFRFVGHTTIGDIHMGDWGMPIGQLIIELEDRQPGLPYFDPEYDESVDGPYPTDSPVDLDDLSEMYPVVTQRCADDPAGRRACTPCNIQPPERAGRLYRPCGVTSGLCRSPVSDQTLKRSMSNSMSGTGSRRFTTASHRWSPDSLNRGRLANPRVRSSSMWRSQRMPRNCLRFF